MNIGVILLGFGEPETPTETAVKEYLERIFLANAVIDSDNPSTTIEDRAEQLAARRTPSLIGEYQAIGGSPLNTQISQQAQELAVELDKRGYPSAVTVGLQFTEPFIHDAVRLAQNNGITHLIGLPTYPLCGPSTTIAALEELTTSISTLEWDVSLTELTGWHRHHTYIQLRTENIAQYLENQSIDLTDDTTAFVFSAHGTPQHYLDHGSKYTQYVREYCAIAAGHLGIESYTIGYQNHETRNVDWTTPAIETVIEDIDANRVVIEPVSFMHEQSETLAELDHDLREHAEDHGLDFYRVPVPHDSHQFITLLADLVISGVSPDGKSTDRLAPCQCRGTETAYCLNTAHTSE